MKKIITVALLCAPFALHAAHFAQESVSFDEDGKPIIQAQLMLPPITARANAHQTSDEVKLSTPLISNNQVHSQVSSSMSVDTTKPVIYQHSHFIYPDENYFDAMNRWFARDDIKQVAWSLDADTMKVLNSAPTGTISFAGTTQSVMRELSRQLGTPFEFTYDRIRNIAALHQFHGRGVQIVEVKGVSIQDAIASIADEYQWHWQEDNWHSPHNFKLQSHYPIVTPKGDINRALNTVLNGYPVNAKLLNSTRTLFITAQ